MSVHQQQMQAGMHFYFKILCLPDRRVIDNQPVMRVEQLKKILKDLVFNQNSSM